MCSLHVRSWAGQRPSEQDSPLCSSTGVGRMALGWGCSAGLKAGLPLRDIPLGWALPVGPETLQCPWAQAQVAMVRERGYSQGRAGMHGGAWACGKGTLQQQHQWIGSVLCWASVFFPHLGDDASRVRRSC